jgi:hypothetical protein
MFVDNGATGSFLMMMARNLHGGIATFSVLEIDVKHV